MSEPAPLSKAEVEILYRRIEALEATVQELADKRPKGPDRWWLREVGRFANDPVYEEILRRGREYRESSRAPDEVDE